jgi:plasmid stabilization system protein ParE
LSTKHPVKLTANFERNLEEIETFLLEVGAPQAYASLLDELTDTIIPNLEKFPEVGRVFFSRPERSIEVINNLERLKNNFKPSAKTANSASMFSQTICCFTRGLVQQFICCQFVIIGSFRLIFGDCGGVSYGRYVCIQNERKSMSIHFAEDCRLTKIRL